MNVVKDADYTSTLNKRKDINFHDKAVNLLDKSRWHMTSDMDYALILNAELFQH